MKKTLFYIFVFIALPSIAFSQNVNLGFSLGTGTNSMNNLKDYQDYYSRSFGGLDLEKASSFPGYVNYSATIETELRRSIFGFNLGYQSTGGRVIYSDYSGLLRSDQTLSSFSFGGYYFIKNKNAISPFLHLELGFINTKMNFSEEIRVNTFSEDFSFDLNSLGSYIHLKTGYLFQVSEIELRPEIGYLFNFFNEQFRFSENENALLKLPNNSKPKPNWSGFRMALRIVFDLK